MTFEGRIEIDLFPGAADGAAKISSNRPLGITRQFPGRRPEEVMRAVSLVFAVCRSAQAAACAGAFEQALGIEARPETKRVRSLLVLMETAREHALRILRDWPVFLPEGKPAGPEVLKDLMMIAGVFERHLNGGGSAMQIGGDADAASPYIEEASVRLSAFLSATVFGEDPGGWRERIKKENLAEWAWVGQTQAQRLIRFILGRGLADAGTAYFTPLPPLHHEQLLAVLFGPDADAFVAAPLWDGLPCETSPLSRQHAHPLVKAMGSGLAARLAACLAELAGIPGSMLTTLDEAEAQPEPANNGEGWAQVEAARGRLIHAVRMEGGHVACYRILAPTEWNFHPHGAAARGLAHIASPVQENIRSLAGLFVTAADPCVGYEVRVH